ncbi:MAG: WcaF family extracellular polysaccharide biosynthesis acetyltransferase [Lentisphaeria bacterium]|nr:WcaF family extracellular polysaccharide biosynthesis acetyltransferase [Lentisphaeria bacterium]
MDIKANRKSKKYPKGQLLKRILWMYCGELLFRLSPRTFFGYRCMILKIFGAKVGAQVHIYNSARITFPWLLEIGDYSAIGENARIYNLGKISIGKNVTISQYAHLCAGTHDYKDPKLPLQKIPIVIDDNVWVCADAFVGPSVTIGENAIVAARAVVIKDVESSHIVAGNPAKFIKLREIND